MTNHIPANWQEALQAKQAQAKQDLLKIDKRFLVEAIYQLVKSMRGKSSINKQTKKGDL